MNASAENGSSVFELVAGTFPPTTAASPLPSLPMSPFNLGADMSKVVQLLLLALVAVVGSVGNIFMISSVMIEDHLNKRGNTFLVCVALADLLVTAFILPARVVVILGDLHEYWTACSIQWQLALVCLLVNALSLLAIAVENHARLCLTSTCYSVLTPSKITALSVGAWALAALAVGLQTAVQPETDYCTRTFSVSWTYQLVVGVVFLMVPAALTFSYFVRTAVCVSAAEALPTFKPPAAFTWDYALMKTNLFSFVVFIICWTPFVTLLGLSFGHYDVPKRLFYNFATFALSKSFVNSFLYCFTNRHFRNAYVNLFHYCCCKTTVSLSRRPRGEPSRPTGDVRVHIIPGYNMYSYTSPQRANREVHKPATQKRNVSSCRPSSSRPGRDVYEL